ncbi:MAG TPA: ABC transporter ATP-binding protein [Chlorobaculum sp.]|uniref:Iron compound ABC transporter, ATP-binding protein n=1 Tax=Chlorobaculum tepidum (strain ATCC 49652 / DSM 12025 / NBRC 103806 / TLS) TaxID=194439 RepID=Q8KDV1_CHLTE|nr:ABC transporter ATP-binding protein [Chlorobaculum tepidum]AAM72178.1 iron compound ABC transporter, ATP-binding protein [Chlorobaculum tepidum TLS]HBU23094.1 ABC transporter ATP-binding protein [Chlorobaculum sp.]
MPGMTELGAPALAFRGVTAGYKGRTVLRDVDFGIAEGEFVSLIGPNGSGKSTLLKTATGLLKASEGKVEVFGREVSSLKPRQRASLIGVVPQKLDSPMAFTVGEIVMLGRNLRGRWTGLEGHDYDSVEKAMIYTNVFDLRERRFNELSAGEQQRTALAMALAQEPRIIMLDESIAHLDINHSQEVLRILMNINREERITVLLVSHDLNLAAQVAGRLMLVQHGRLVKNGSPEEVMQPELLSRVYDCELRVRRDPFSGNPVVSGALDELLRRPAVRKRLHIICGGGSGIELFRRLFIEGFELTSGVLNRLDSDAEAARALDIPCVLEQPFSAVGDEAFQQAAAMVSEADGVVIGPVPIGSGNLVNLRLAAEALDAGKPVWIASGLDKRDYTPGKEAAEMSDKLRKSGATEWKGIQELTAMLNRAWPESQH